MLKSSVRLHMVVWLIAVQVNCTAFTGGDRGVLCANLQITKDCQENGEDNTAGINACKSL